MPRPLSSGRFLMRIFPLRPLAAFLASTVGAFVPLHARHGTQFVNGGLTLLLSGDFQLDARVGSGVGRNGRDLFAGLGLARRW